MRETKRQTRGAVSGGIMLVLALAGFMGVGCRSIRVERPRRVEPPLGGPVTAESQARMLNIDIQSQAHDKDSERAAADVKRAVEGAMSAQGYRLDPSYHDLRVSLNTHVEPFDAAGNYYVFDGRVEAGVVRVVDGRILGKQTFETRGERKLGRPAAERLVSAPLGSQAADWIIAQAAPAASGLAVEDITVRAGRFTSNDRIAEFSANFTERVKVEPGIVSCLMVRQDTRSRELVFRIVYFADQINEGLLNRLTTITDIRIR